MALSEKNGVDRERVMSILSSSIFDCLIYKVQCTIIRVIYVTPVELTLEYLYLCLCNTYLCLFVYFVCVFSSGVWSESI